MRLRQYIVVPLIIIAASCDNSQERTANASVAYWSKLRDISAQGKKLGDKSKGLDVNTITMQQQIDLSHSVDEEITKLITELKELPVTDVDADIVKLAADQIELLEGYDSLIIDAGNLIKTNQDLPELASSWGQVFDQFMRGLAHDNSPSPLEKRRSNVSAQLHALQDREAALDERTRNPDGREVTLRQSLSAKYHRDFPSTD
jgi:hypothetical protein